MIKLKSILLEKLPADLKKDIGNVLFGEDPDIADLQSQDTESNTKWENSVYKKIKSWTDTSDKSTADFFLKNKDKFEALRKEFPEIIAPPVGDFVYRGSKLKVSSLKKALPLLTISDVDYIGYNASNSRFGKVAFFAINNFPYKPHLSAQSWTLNSFTAREFGSETHPKDRIQVIYKTKVNNEFVFNPEFMNIVYGDKEDEVVRVAKEGSFTALINSYELTYTLNTHLFKQATMFFEDALIEYNEIADSEGYYTASSWNKIAAEYDYNIESLPDFGRKLYTDAADAFIKSLK